MTDTTNLLSDETIWQRTFDAVPDLIFVLDNEHRIVRANRAAAERLGCPAEGLDGIFTDTEEMRVISLLGEISLQDATLLMGRI